MASSEISRSNYPDKKIDPKRLINEEELRYIFDRMLEGIQIHDFNWRYVYVNDALVNYSTFKKDELLGYTLMEKHRIPPVNHVSIA